MRMRIDDWGSPRGLGCIIETGGKLVEDRRLWYGVDVAERPEDATEQMPFIVDAVQNVIHEYGITNPVTMSPQTRILLEDLSIPKREFTPSKGQAVWFPVENGIKITDPFSTAADPAMGYVKSVSEDGMVTIDARQIYKRTAPPNSIYADRKMQSMDGTAHIHSQFCFGNRRECMDCIIAQSEQGGRAPIFWAEITTEQNEKLLLTDEDLANITMSKESAL